MVLTPMARNAPVHRRSGVDSIPRLQGRIVDPTMTFRREDLYSSEVGKSFLHGCQYLGLRDVPGLSSIRRDAIKPGFLFWISRQPLREFIAAASELRVQARKSSRHLLPLATRPVLLTKEVRDPHEPRPVNRFLRRFGSEELIRIQQMRCRQVQRVHRPDARLRSLFFAKIEDCRQIRFKLGALEELFVKSASRSPAD